MHVDEDDNIHRINFTPTTGEGSPFVLSREFVNYVINKGYKSINGKTYEINMDEWDRSIPFGMFDPKQGVNNSADRFMRILTNGAGKKGPYDVVDEMMEIMRGITKPSLTSLCVILYAFSTIDTDVDSEAVGTPLPRGRVKEAILPGNSALVNGSTLSTALPNDGSLAAILNPNSFVEGSKRDSPYDIFFDTQAVLEARTSLT
jgi:hypothetical protein